MLEYSNRVAVSGADRASYLEFACRVAEEAGRATLPYFRAEVQIENKHSDGRYDPVTEADRGAERVIRQAIGSEYPRHGILGEEYGYQEGNGLTWVIDPIDGTRAFMTGMLHWGVLLALFDGQDPVVGVMHQPFTGETFFGDCHSAWYEQRGQKRQLGVRACSKLDSAVVASTGPQWFSEGRERQAFERLVEATLFTRFGGDCYLYAMLAMGYVDLATDANLNPYDIQPLVPIIRGAGGVITTWAGDNPSMGGAVLASGDAAVHEAALKVLAG
ncbi:MAG: histidinol-phosphatase [Pseudomonadales bacterium]|jgi:myo-inositol-1(or 4)-monophosphatase|nr:histidinol-phosphatase [Pseudomonadales bacterium]MDP6470165.1 histidinol-phosphatase [Pseudomonadales bacterium]MDP6827071.1 histidinol-phosphatase [Pseudomonadales bacterium]